jgi:hypothetical protein
LDIIDLELASAKKRMNMEGAWSVVERVEQKFGSTSRVNPMLLEAEVKHVLSSNGEPGHSAAQEGEEDDGEERVNEVVSEQENWDTGKLGVLLSSDIPEPKAQPDKSRPVQKAKPVNKVSTLAVPSPY